MPLSSAREAAEKIAKSLREQGFQALFAGGCVRDLLLGREPKDFDVATDARPDQVTTLFRRAELVGAKFGVVVVRLGGRHTEVATFREDGRYLDGRHPETVTYGNAQTDARRRDFTINGLFMDPATEAVIDYVDGQADLRAGVLRAIGDPDRRFSEDRLRILRAIRFAARLGFEMEPETFHAIRHHAPHLPEISTERIRMELEMILDHDSRALGWHLMRETELTGQLVPGFAWSDEAAESVEQRLGFLPAGSRWPAPLAVLWHTETGQRAASLCRALTCSNDVCRQVSWLLERRRFFLDRSEWELADLRLLRADELAGMLLDLATAESGVTPELTPRLAALRSALDKIDPAQAAPAPWLTGDDLLAMNLPQGPCYRVILEKVYRAQLNGSIQTKAEAADLARSLFELA